MFAASLAFFLLGCASVSSGDQKYKLSDAGYASVKKAPAIARETSSDEVSFKLNEVLARSMISQKYAEEARALENRLRANEAGNFADLRIIWEPEFHYLISFLKDADVTLAKYTSNPIFKPTTVRFTAERLEAKSKEFHDALAALYPKHDVGGESSIDVLKGKVIAYLDLYEEDFETLPTFDAFREDPMVELNYHGPLDPPEVLSGQAKLLIRHFVHSTIREPTVIIGSFSGKILLKDGCFFLDDGKGADQLLVFPKRVGVVIDDEGYIALVDRSPHPGNKTTTRVGEPAQWYSGPKPVTDPEVLAPLQTACGTHDAVIIGAPMPVSKN